MIRIFPVGRRIKMKNTNASHFFFFFGKKYLKRNICIVAN